jgi:hypothetical protein
VRRARTHVRGLEMRASHQGTAIALGPGAAPRYGPVVPRSGTVCCRTVTTGWLK